MHYKFKTTKLFLLLVQPFPVEVRVPSYDLENVVLDHKKTGKLSAIRVQDISDKYWHNFYS